MNDRGFHPRRRLRRRRHGGERSFQPRSTLPPSLRDCRWRDSGARTPIRPFLAIALPTLKGTLPPSRDERQDRSWQIEVGCAQPARISCPSPSTGARTTSRVGGGFSCSGGLRPRWSRMRLMDNSSVMYATILSGPALPLQTSGSACYTLLMSRAQLGGQRLLVGATSPGAPQSRWTPPSWWPVLLAIRMAVRRGSARRPSGVQVGARRLAPHTRGQLDAPERPAQPPQRQYLLFLLFVQDVHPGGGSRPTRLCQRLGPLRLVAGFQVSISGRF